MTQTFVRRNRPSSVTTTPSYCEVRPCNSTGLYRWDIFGHPQGLVCSKHRAELERAWNDAKEDA